MPSDRLAQFVQSAWLAGQGVNLGDLGYGRIHWGNQTDVLERTPTEYYFTLAGFAALTKSRSALEIGTHWGGSAVAILRGMKANSASPELVTVDITRESDNFLLQSDEGRSIKKIVGDANTFPIITDVMNSMSKADLIYIDAEHTALPTLQSFFIYSTLLRPKIALFDDVSWGDQMRSFWKIFCEMYPGHTVNCSEVEPRARNPDCGFGLWVNPDLDLSTMALAEKI